MSEWQTLETVSSRAEAEMLKSFLEDQGIQAVISGDDAGGMRPELAMTLGIKVLIHGDNLESAKKLLKELEEAEQSPDQ